MKHILILAFALVGFLSAPVRAEVNFESLRCSGGPGLSTRVFRANVQNDELTFHYESSGMHRLLEAIFPAGTPPELSGLYACMELKFAIPVSDCTPTSNKLEHIACESKAVKLEITAKDSCYLSSKKKVYKGKATTFSFATQKVVKYNRTYLNHDWSFAFKRKDEVVSFTDSYIAHYWEAESGIGRPYCRVDDYVINYGDPE